MAGTLQRGIKLQSSWQHPQTQVSINRQEINVVHPNPFKRALPQGGVSSLLQYWMQDLKHTVVV